MEATCQGGQCNPAVPDYCMRENKSLLIYLRYHIARSLFQQQSLFPN